MALFQLRDRYRHGDGPLYRLDPAVKILVVLLFAFAAVLVPAGDWPTFAGLSAFVAAAIVLSRLPPRTVFGRSLLALPFVLVAVPLLFTREGDTLFRVPILGWTASRAGAVALATIVLRSWLTVLLATVLTGVTRPLDLIRGLERLRLPRIIVVTVLFMYRYIFVIGEEGQRLMRARDARSARAGARRAGGGVGWRGRVLGGMVGSLFLRSLERGERIYLAMQARGYDGSLRLLDEPRAASRDWLIVALLAAILFGWVLRARL